MPARADVVRLARLLDGLSASETDPDVRARYLALVAPGEEAQKAAEMARMSGCALVARGILREVLEHELLERTYRIGHAMSDLVEIARRAGGFYDYADRIPEPGDLVIVGEGAAEHVWIAVELLGDDGRDCLDFDGLDGGQVDEHGAQCIRLRRHELARGVDRTGGRNRDAHYVLDLDAMLRAFGR
jgi:hypothetical protein